MKIVIICGDTVNYDYNTAKLTKLVNDILTELGVEVSEIHLSECKVPLSDGAMTKAAGDILTAVDEASGVVFVTSVRLFSPSAMMHTLLEYFLLNPKPLKGKNCLLAAVSKNGGEKSALEYMSKAVGHFGAFDSVKIGLNESLVNEIEIDGTTKTVIEKQIEDFYRLVRAGRKFFIPGDYEAPAQSTTVRGITPDELAKYMPEKPRMAVADIYKKLNLTELSGEGERDITELTQHFAKKLSSPETKNLLKEPLPYMGGTPAPRGKSCRQLTQSLPHYYQAQLANGLSADIAFVISGDDPFEGHIVIKNTECEYFDGTPPNPDITIISDASVWNDVLKGKFTAQKAFMIGKLKVRGNFVLLTKFDQMFLSKPLA